jgi:tRNA (cmo5U34)-methyltransferase
MGGINLKRDQIFMEANQRASDFEFNEKVAEVFDDMISRSVPFYVDQQAMIREIGRKFAIKNTNICDLGCSTATTLINLCQVVDDSIVLIGYDNSMPMINRAKQKIKEHGFDHRIALRYCDLNGDVSDLNLENASMITMCWTLQFVRPLKRDNLIKAIYNGLVQDGVLVVTEKVLTNTSHMNRFFIDFYYDYKKRQGYSNEEIQNKREALENVLVPYRREENLEMFIRNGFEIVETFFQWYNFAAFLCVKKPT